MDDLLAWGGGGGMMQRDPLYGRVTGEIRWWLLAARAEEGLKDPFLC